MGQLFEALRHFATTVAAQGLALVFTFLIICVIRMFWQGSIDPIDVFNRFIGKGHTAEQQPEQSVNVEYRAADGSNLDLGSYLTATLQNSRGKSFRLVEGYFVACNPTHIKVGAACSISIQGGCLHEEIRVQLDDVKEVLFVQSKYASRRQISELLGHRRAI